jgi:hypothetical protein
MLHTNDDLGRPFLSQPGLPPSSRKATHLDGQARPSRKGASFPRSQARSSASAWRHGPF